MRILHKFLLVLTIPLIHACSDNHLINNKRYLYLIEKSFAEKKQLAKNRESELFSVFCQPLSVKQTEALKFLFAYMPLCDLADYNGDFFKSNCDVSLRAMEEVPWGKDVPEEIFLHYVLPCRVNNENLDSFRIVYYDEIMDRIKNKDILEAALEINYWCHEKVSYQPADSRTSAPMSTIMSARGRCGEESTLTVAALRTAGIPARQVYTPRWAHTDDNHAWVEIWSDGTWYYMGACEPEPVLDRGWFTEPARRAMLIHTKSFGLSLGNENAINRHKNFAEVNNLAKYAVTKRIFIKVTDVEGVPVSQAKVEYQLYNYAEFYPLSIVPTDENGISQFETGLGDLLIWAHKNEEFDYMKISVSETDTLTLKLTRKPETNFNFDLDLDVPIARSPLPVPKDEMIRKNSERINTGNIIRRKYIDSWLKAEEAKKFAIELNFDTARIMNIFARSMGNCNEIKSFLTGTPDSLKSLAVSMLEILSDKDLRDTKAHILSDHLLYSYLPVNHRGNSGYDFYIKYTLNPRIANEMMVDYRHYFRNVLPSDLLKRAEAEPYAIAEYLEKNIIIADDENYYNTPLSPKGVSELKVSDTRSRAICFVAICRSLGIPSRLEPGSKVPQYFFDNIWNDVFFSDQKIPGQKKGFLKLVSSDTKPVPEYYIHFTIARFENGRYYTLEYDENKKITAFKEELSLAPGSYMLVTGNRIDDNKILSNISFFDLSEDEHKTIQVKLRKEISEGKVLGKIDLKSIADHFDQTRITSSRIVEKGVVIIWIEPDKEPTKHILNDLPHLREEFDSWGGYFLFLSDSPREGYRFKPEELKAFPVNTLFSFDSQINYNSFKFNESSDIKLPYVVMADKEGNILFTSSGYRIGIGEQILKHIE